MIIKGRVVSGKHEARFFTLLPEYQRFLRSLLSIGPYPGTLNVLLEREIRLSKVFVPSTGRPIRRARVRRISGLKVNALALMPGKPSGKILEIVSTMKLRKLLRLRDGKEVMLSVEEEAEIRGDRDPS